VKQITGQYKTNEALLPFNGEAKLLIAEFSEFTIKWIPRGDNLVADELARGSLGGVPFSDERKMIIEGARVSDSSNEGKNWVKGEKWRKKFKLPNQELQ